MTRSPLRLPAALLTAAVLLGGAAGSAMAQTQSHPVGRGRIPAPPIRWEAEAVPQGLSSGRTSLLIDAMGAARTQTYAGTFSAPGFGRRRIQALEARPFARPTRAALVYGAVGRAIRRVRVFFRSGPSRSFRTVAPARDWGISAYRYFVVGTSVAARHAGRFRVSTRIDGFNADGERIARTRRITAF